MQRRNGLILAVGLLSLASGGFADPVVPRGQKRPNVLFIAIDDLRPELGCYGVEDAQSPEMDRFAATAVRFENHFVQCPTCGASRYALLTGRSPLASGVVANNEALYRGRAALQTAPTPAAQSLPEAFRRNDYYTVCIGKISHAPDGRVYAYDGSGDGRPELPHAWDELATPFGPWERGWGAFFAYADGKHREDGQGHQALMEFTAEQDEDLPDGLMAATAIEQLQTLAERDQPFFLGLGFFKPHLPFVATRRDWEAFEDADLALPRHRDRLDSPYWHRSGEFRRYDSPFAKSELLTQDEQRQTRRAYLACVRYVDRQVGRVLTALEEAGLADNTVVVIWGDHGWHLGEYAIWGKHTPFEESLRSVLMIRSPGIEPRAIGSLAETIDLPPTLFELCGLKETGMAHPLDGVSLAPVLRGERAEVRDAAVSCWRDAISVRTGDNRLIVRRDGAKLTPVHLFETSGEQPKLARIDDPAATRLLKIVREGISSAGK